MNIHYHLNLLVIPILEGRVEGDGQTSFLLSPMSGPGGVDRNQANMTNIKLLALTFFVVFSYTNQTQKLYLINTNENNNRECSQQQLQ